MKLYIRFLSLHVFDPKLDHPDANVINCIYKRVHLNPRGWKHGKHSCAHQIRSTLFCSSLKLYLRFLSLHVFDPKLDHTDANVINSINNRVNLNPRGWKHDQSHL